MGQSCPLLFSIPSILTIPSQQQEKAMQNGGRIFSSRQQAAMLWKRHGQEGNGVCFLPLVARNNEVQSCSAQQNCIMLIPKYNRLGRSDHQGAALRPDWLRRQSW